MPTRRDFLRNLPLITGTVAWGVSAAFKPAEVKKDFGIQLWTLRDDVAKDLDITLQEVAKIGYNSIEAFWFDGKFYGRDAVEFSRYCADLGLALHSTHTGISDKNADLYAEIAAKAGLEYLILPSMMGRPESTIDDILRTASEMNRIGAICFKHGINFGYHNHDFEFRPIDGQLPYDVLLSETDPELVSFQVDIYWMIKAGKDPIKYFEENPGRFNTWHIKDKGNDGESCIIGNGSIDFKTLIKQNEASGLQRIFVEQEQYAEGNPLYCAAQSYNYIKNNLL